MPRLVAAWLFPALLLIGCAAPFLNSKRDYIVVEDITQVPDSDPFGIADLRVEDDSLKFTASYGGGCRDHIFTLYAARSEPGTNTGHLYIHHNANHDMCRAWIDAHKVSFGLKGLRFDLRLGENALLELSPGADSGFVLRY
jgi:hypothetical protein